MMEHDIKSIAENFNLAGKLIQYEPFGSGHINDTYCLTCEKDNRQIHYILQRINHEVFKNPPQMMENIRRVTNHIRRKLQKQQNKLTSRQLVVIESSSILKMELIFAGTTSVTAGAYIIESKMRLHTIL
ncbi:MAG: hypothetical protein ACYS3S_17450 [Planctomycetota bacterium]|jgi:hypothetical protein